MEMLLMGACLSMFGLAVTCLAFGAATRTAAAPEPKLEPMKAAAPSRFFVQQVPLEILLMQIENHVRLEQAAVESFLQTPTPDLLHSRTMSTFIN